jgi:bifunctional DNase/RNase
MPAKVRLRILGLTYSQAQTGSYALVLAEEKGERRIPIMIGAFEAQAIALHLEELHPPRPLTHDLFRSFARAYSIELKEVFINKLEEGIFYSELVFFNGDDIVTIDSRTSDAVALALRFKCPIFTSPDILDKAGIIMEEKSKDIVDLKEEPEEKYGLYSDKTDEELQALLDEAIDSEDYEKASQLRDELNRRGKGG